MPFKLLTFTLLFLFSNLRSFFYFSEQHTLDLEKHMLNNYHINLSQIWFYGYLPESNRLMTINIPLAVVLLTFCCGAIQHPGNDLVRLTWLRGTWENSTRQGTQYESWMKISEHELAAKSYMLKG